MRLCLSERTETALYSAGGRLTERRRCRRCRLPEQTAAGGRRGRLAEGFRTKEATAGVERRSTATWKTET